MVLFISTHQRMHACMRMWWPGLTFVCTRSTRVQMIHIHRYTDIYIDWRRNGGEEETREKWHTMITIYHCINSNCRRENLTPWIWHRIRNISLWRHKRQPFKYMLVSNIENVALHWAVIFNGNVLVNMAVANGCCCCCCCYSKITDGCAPLLLPNQVKY